MPTNGVHVPRFSFREVRMGVRAERIYVPTLGGVGAEEDSAVREVIEIARLVGARGGIVKIIEHMDDRSFVVRVTLHGSLGGERAATSA